MRDGTWKVVAGAPGQKQPGLFNLADDLAEQTDIAAEKPEVVERLLAEMNRFRSR